MIQNNQLIFSSRYRKQRTSVTIRRRPWSCPTNFDRCRQIRWRFACWFAGCIRTL